MKENSTVPQLLNWDFIKNKLPEFGVKEGLIHLPEKVIQFGTGMLLRGLADYLIDKANKNNYFNGRVVVIKSTGNSTDEFIAQDNFYTILEKGIYERKPFEQKNIITCISRVLPAQHQWKNILQCAADPAIEIVVSNTTEAGLVFEQERFSDEAPKSFPAKLTAYLWHRYKAFRGDGEKGMIILPTELVSNNGELLKQFVLQHASYNDLSKEFINWINNSNYFCNTLVDRIVPGKSEKDDLIHWDDTIQFMDHLHITVEPYLLWAIEGNEIVQQKLSFLPADIRAVVTESIEGFKEQKLRILNGSNTAVVAPAYLAGLNTVYDTVTDTLFATFTQQLIDKEITPTIVKSYPGAQAFAKEVMDRFRNPYIRYPLLNVTLQCSGKMNNRNVATIIRYHKMFNAYPPLMSIGLAAFFLFYTPTGEENGAFYFMRDNEKYFYRDEHTTFLCSALQVINWNDAVAGETAVTNILTNAKIFSPEIITLPGIAGMIASLCRQLTNEGMRKTIEQNLKH